MYVFEKLVDNARKLKAGRVFILTFSDPNLKSLVVSLNKDQLRMGEGANEQLLPNYSEVSVTQFGKPSGRWRLFDTGETYDSFKVVKVTEEAIIEFGDLEIHDVDLQEKVNAKSNAEILGLNGESLAILIDEALPIVREVILFELLKGID